MPAQRQDGFRPLPVFDRRLAFVGADFVDDLQNTFAVGAELHAEFLHHPAVVDHEVARPLPAAGLVVKGNLRVGQEFTHEVGQVAQADRVAAGIVDGVVRLVLHDHSSEDFGDLVDVDRGTHRVLVGELDGFAARRIGDAENVIDRAYDLVGTGHVGWADRRDLHSVFLAVILRLPFVEDFVHRVLHMAVLEIVFVDDAVAIEFLLAADRYRTGIDEPVAAREPRRLEAIVHAQNVELESNTGRQVATDVIGKVDYPVGLYGHHHAHQIVELADVATQHPHFREFTVICGLRVDVHANSLFAVLREERGQGPANKPSAADDQCRHLGY